ncbi:MAG: response regulator, partial [Acidobacteriota bacterium]|nr:response regulator [Acidobacteriota bacterium]
AYSGRGRFLVESLDVSDLVREMSGLLETVISENALLRCEPASDLPPIDADVTQLRQVIMNLITNASDAVGERGGLISVRTGQMYADRGFFQESYLQPSLPEGSYVYLEVEDDGAGMKRETKTRIFDPFFSTKFTGRGLGLAAVLGIVRGHHGAIHIRSSAGRGTVFRIVFPPGTLAATKEPERAPNDESWTAEGCVLVVDDEASVRITSRRILEKAGFEVLTARDGHEALELFGSRGEIDLVVLDLTMPRMGGEEVLERLLELRGDVPVLLASGYAEEEIDRRFARSRPAGFVQKPFDVRSLLQAVRSVTSAKRSEARSGAQAPPVVARRLDAS